MEIIEKRLNELTPYKNNPRKNDQAVDAVAASISHFGFKVPIVIDRDGVIVCGHTRAKAAKKLKLESVPCVVADDLTEEEIKAFRLADNKVGELAEWDFEMLDFELGDLDFDMSDFGFDDVNTQEDSNAEPEFLDTYNNRYNIIIKCEDLMEAEECVEKLGVKIDLTRQVLSCKYSDIKI